LHGSFAPGSPRVPLYMRHVRSQRGCCTMRAFDIHKLDLPIWVWILAAVAAVMMLSGLLWGGSPGDRGKVGLETASATPAPPNQAAPSARVAGPRIMTFGSQPDPARTTVRITPVSKPSARIRAFPCLSGAKPKSTPVTPKSMFPVGPIVRQAPAGHPYRQPSEGFASFSYGHRMWSFVGQYVRFDQIDLVPIGYNLGGRTVFAIANTAGPGGVLFVQSGLDPGKLAVYRHS
jgi:hypothetical protein